ncbi:hypothetical protein [Hespellia stercorisuis]|uniref:SnoaL-like domain-containing protein n=1 Tax=Hespellia stercorisuis DSM 15480 TaxID=1121950 RepID=A0A1M6MTA2_9FIRM|nr:hypothetical protein [Hespellia stercorisuis]SHJ86636.1 hypothetical protein SAMN02745243_01580 [Hespellia stercorisuis DSM 15480]
MIREVIKTIKDGDYKGLAALFSVRSNYSDFMPNTIGRNDYHIYGRKSIEMFFQNKLFFHEMVITNVEYESETSANYLAVYNGENLHAQMRIENIDNKGKIKRLVVRPTAGEFAKYVNPID